MKYALVKKWFYYTDDNTEADGNLSPSIGVYQTIDEANIAKLKNDIKSLRAYLIYLHEDLIRGLSYWYDRTEYHNQIEKLKDLLSSDDFSSNVKKIGSEPQSYYFKSVDDLSDDNLRAIIDLLDLSFHEILSYERVKKEFYALINADKWEYDIISEMMQNGLVTLGGYRFDLTDNEWASVIRERSGYNLDVHFESHDKAELQTVMVLKEFIDVYPEYFEIVNKPIKEIAIKNREILESFIKESFSFRLNENEDDTFINLSDNSIDLTELKAILKLVDDEYYKILEVETEINGIKTTVIGESSVF